jgi:hypothetical protein
LLQPCNLRLLEIPKLSNPTNAIRFILFEEWYKSGRDFWACIYDALNEPKKAHGHARGQRGPAGGRKHHLAPLTPC